MRIRSMTTVVLPAAAPVSSNSSARADARRRRMTPQVGRALEVLGHSIEYLADEFMHSGGSLSPRDGQIEAIQLLMAANRKLYLSCPEVRTFSEWLLTWLRKRPSHNER